MVPDDLADDTELVDETDEQAEIADDEGLDEGDIEQDEEDDEPGAM